MHPNEPIKVFIENEAGSEIKNHYNEETLEFLRTEIVGSRYPYPYGFIPGTLAPDGDAADCFVITESTFGTGETVECEPVALIEQTEGGITDHNVIAVPCGDPLPDLDAVKARIGHFLERFMRGVEERKAIMGRVLPVADAHSYLDQCTRAAAAADR